MVKMVRSGAGVRMPVASYAGAGRARGRSPFGATRSQYLAEQVLLVLAEVSRNAAHAGQVGAARAGELLAPASVRTANDPRASFAHDARRDQAVALEAVNEAGQAAAAEQHGGARSHMRTLPVRAPRRAAAPRRR